MTILFCWVSAFRKYIMYGGFMQSSGLKLFFKYVCKNGSAREWVKQLTFVKQGATLIKKFGVFLLARPNFNQCMAVQRPLQ